ncbi:MAG: DUF4124 domain-containing protein [Gammaproteobacteria bacterium]|nr:DUF4124 domain-containing protein [Gammaproteobacteria bacterium]
MLNRSFLRLGPLALLVALAGSPSGPVEAKLYKWVDENGNVTYSERKPPDKQATEIKVRTAPVTPDQSREQLEGLKDKTDTQQKDRDYATTAANEDAAAAEQLKKNCEIARQNKRVLENTSRIQGQDSQGNTYFLNEAEIAAKLEQSKKQIELYCK